MSDLTISFMGYDVELNDVSYYGGRPAKLNAEPEDCDPAEPEEIEYTIATGNELLDLLLTEEYEEEISELVIEKIESDAEGQRDAYWEAKAEDMKMERMGY